MIILLFGFFTKVLMIYQHRGLDDPRLYRWSFKRMIILFFVFEKD